MIKREELPTLMLKWGMLVAQLVERSHPTPEIRSSNPDIGKILYTNCKIYKTKNKGWEWPIIKKQKHLC